MSRAGAKPWLWPLCAIDHPEHGRIFARQPPDVKWLLIERTWVADIRHPLGGYLGSVQLKRRVNLRKDSVPQWITRRPLFEYTKEAS